MKLYLLTLFLTFQSVFAMPFTISKVEPPNWWCGMEWDTLQLMVYGADLKSVTAYATDPSLQVLHTSGSENGDYLFIDLFLKGTLQPGSYSIHLEQKDLKYELEYAFYAKDTSTQRAQGFSQEDVIYLITPDRFVNGDSTNDHLPGLRDKRGETDIIGRHGGDISGIFSKLSYLKELGITGIWINPLLTNDMEISYHGYAATDLYEIDPRFGDKNLYRQLVETAHSHNIKVILDHVSNHVGIHHPWVTSIPSISWFNGNPDNHLYSTHEKQILFDIHSDSSQIRRLREGWFVDVMPDLNQKNPYVSNYLIQNTLWWIEFSGLDAIREDTYPYVDPVFLQKWMRAIQADYPNLTVLAEVWVHDPVFLAHYQNGSPLSKNNPARLNTITDFGLFEAFSQIFYRRNGLFPLYEFISRDVLYSDPNSLLTFLDNHDVLRFMDVVQDDVHQYIMGLSILLTTRGIPQIYYGTEIGLSGGGKDHGQIRAEFPGGFAHHKRNAFIKPGRTAKENFIFDTTKKLISIRRNHPEFTQGDLIHFPPHENVYLYFRRMKPDQSLVVVNGNDHPKTVEIDSLKRYFKNISRLLDLQKQREFPLSETNQLQLDVYEVAIFKLLD